MGKLINIQVMRAFAAIMVAFLHCQVTISELAKAKGEAIWKFSAVDLSYGVDVFFIISGFVIASSSGKLLLNKNGFEFFRKRIIRIAPSYWFFTLALIAATLAASFVTNVKDADKVLDLKNIICSLLFIPNDTYGYGLDAPLPILFVGWTLNFEMLFYLLFGAFIFTGGSLKSVSLRTAGVIGALVALGTLFPGLKLPWLFWTRPICVEFVAGLMLAHLYGRNVRIGAPLQAVLAITGLSVWLLVKQSYFGPGAFNPHVTMGWPRVFAGGVGALLIMSAAILGKWEVRGLVGHILARLGDGSYTLYLFHPIASIAFSFFANRFLPGAHWNAWHVLALLALAIISSQIFYEIFEKRALRLLETTTKQWMKAPA